MGERKHARAGPIDTGAVPAIFHQLLLPSSDIFPDFQLGLGSIHFSSLQGQQIDALQSMQKCRMQALHPS